MSEASTERKEVLLGLVDMAYTDIVDIVSELSSENASAAKESCQGHIDDIGMAAGMISFDVLQASTEQMSALLTADIGGLTAELANQLVGWMGDIVLHIESPGDVDINRRLLNLVPEDRAIEAAELSDEIEAIDVFGEELDDFSENIIDKNDLDSASSGILGILIEELQDISLDLDDLALTISNTEDANELTESVISYQDILSRVRQVASDLGLNGLVLIGNFIDKNLLILTGSSLTERAHSLEVLQGWIPVVIEHLQQPKDDALCIAVVDYLERDNWLSPLPYREVRDLIEGLTKELELSGDFEVEARETEARADDVALDVSTDAGPELLDAFFAESPGHAEKFSTLVEAIANGEDIQNNVEAAQRLAHTLKGSGNLVGVKGIANLAHHIEDIFEHIAKQKMAPPSALALTMQEAADTIEVMFEYLQGMAEFPDEAQRVLQDVLDWANLIDSGNLSELSQSESIASEVSLIEPVASVELKQYEESISDFGDNFSDSFGENRRATDIASRTDDTEAHPRRATDGATSGRVDSVRVPTDILDNIFRIVGETAIAIGQIQEHINRLESGDKLVRKNDVSLQQRRYELENLVSIRGMAARHRSAAVVGGDSSFDPLEMDEYDEFYGVAHSYIEGVADSREILRSITGEVSELNALFLLQQRLNKELQQVVMTTRMVPVSNISARLQRSVRQACRSTGKNAVLKVIGEDLLLDGKVLNSLTDSLMHMLRNAVDHSIESAENRFDKGKPEAGEITLSFVQEGNNVVVSCVDDGRGLDYDRIRDKAVKQGMIGQNEAIDNRALARMVLQSGFSTSDKVTQVSGRGVGMDVVNNTIQSLKGSMDIGDAVTGGAQISLRLPITLLTSHCLIVGVDEEAFAVPTSTLSQILSPGTGKIDQVGGNTSCQIGREVYPVDSLNSLVGQSEDLEKMNNSTILLFQTAQGMTAITVDRVVSSYDLVIKGMGEYIKDVPGVAGVSTLGDGSVVAVLDLGSLMQSKTQSRPNTGYSQPVVGGAKSTVMALPKVLVVEDSLSARNSLTQLMNDGGYQVVIARDGLEAVDVLDKENPDIVLTDLEMPRMNGLELVSYIRNSDQWGSLPVVMITSRTMMKHRQEAESAGVNQYITKPFTEDDVLASVSDNLGLA